MLNEADIKAAQDLGGLLEEIADATFELAVQEHPYGTPEYSQAMGDYQLATAKVQHLYYVLAHHLTDEIMARPDLDQLTEATRGIRDHLATLQKVEGAVGIVLDVATVVGTVTATVVDPTHLSALGAVKAVADLGLAIAELATKKDDDHDKKVDSGKRD
jgi:hypothetical protein